MRFRLSVSQATKELCSYSKREEIQGKRCYSINSHGYIAHAHWSFWFLVFPKFLSFSEIWLSIFVVLIKFSLGKWKILFCPLQSPVTEAHWYRYSPKQRIRYKRPSLRSDLAKSTKLAILLNMNTIEAISCHVPGNRKNKYSVGYKKVVFWQCMDVYLNSNCHLRTYSSKCEFMSLVPLMASWFFKSHRQCWCVTCAREKIFKTTPEWVWLSQTGQEKYKN